MKFYYLKNGILCICTALVLIIGGCKKGEDDPALSLTSRKARVAGEWNMKSAHVVFGIKNAGGAQPSLTYDIEQTRYRLTNGKGGHFVGPASLKMVFKKNGTFTLKQTLDTVSYEGSGKWDFQGKVGKDKNKEVITLRLDNVSGESNFYTLFNKSMHTFSYRIKELRKSKLVLVCEEEALALDQTNTSYYVSSEYVFEY